MNKLWLIICSVLLVACGGESDATGSDAGLDTTSPKTQTVDQVKEGAIEFVDQDSGLTYSKIEIDDTQNIVVNLDNNAEFALVSNADIAEKLVVKGLLTIK